jgi:signal transduction histidine kinase
MRLSLRYRLLLPLTLLLIVEAAATAWAAWSAARNAERQLAAQQWAVARTLTEPRSTFPLTERVLQQMKGFSGAEFLFAPTTGPSASTFPDPQPAPPTDVPTAIQPLVDEDPTLGPPLEIAGATYRCLRLPLRPPHPQAGSDLYILYPESLRRTAVRDAVRPLLVLGGLGGLVAVALAIAFASRLVHRIRDLEARTRLIAAGDFRTMPVPTSNDELRDLCESVNDMARRLTAFQEQLQQDERLRILGQFSGGLAHQLRNAATGAKLAIELFLQENQAPDPEPLRVALRQLARIESNLRQFLDLGKPPVELKQPCDLVQLIDQAVSLSKPQAQHASTTLVWTPPASACVVMGDSVQLGHLLGNLIGNAVEAAGPGGIVEVQLLAPSTSRGYVIEVIDTGPGPPAQIAERLFEPFVTGKEQGIGLGLAVAQQAAQAHGSDIGWQRRDGKTVFHIDIPKGEQPV